MSLIKRVQEGVKISACSYVNSIQQCVKELLENSLDSSATCVQLDLTDCGLSRVRLQDDGCGISETDMHFLRDSFDRERGGVSGKKNDNSTLGFRGMALACIVQLSRQVVIQSGTWELTLKSGGGECRLHKMAKVVKGTAVTVSEIFNKLPVRKQEAMRHQQQILKDLQRLMSEYHLLYPQVSLMINSYASNNNLELRSQLQFARSRQPFVTVFGAEVARQMVHTVHQDGEYSIDVAVLQNGPTIANVHYCALNGRPVQIKFVTNAIRQRLQQLQRNNTLICIQLHLPLTAYDINVEPMKTCVMFHDRDRVDKLLSKWMKSHLPIRVEQIVSAQVTNQTVQLLNHAVSPVHKKPRRQVVDRVQHQQSSVNSYLKKKIQSMREKHVHAADLMLRQTTIDDYFCPKARQVYWNAQTVEQEFDQLVRGGSEQNAQAKVIGVCENGQLAVVVTSEYELRVCQVNKLLHRSGAKSVEQVTPGMLSHMNWLMQ